MDKRPIIHAVDGPLVTIDGRLLINFTSNDYLGLANHPVIRESMINGVHEWGVGSTGSRRLSGNHKLFLDVEACVADWVQKPAGVLFNSGYQMNVTLFSTMATSDTVFLVDKQAHASILDGIRHSKGSWRRFRHNDMGHLRDRLEVACAVSQDVVIVTESLFSMDGDMAPIREMVELKRHYGARLVVDEAHSIGVYGDQGRGWCVQNHCLDDVDILLVTFGKAFGLCGAMVLTDQRMGEYIKDHARSYIYSTALPLPMASAIHAAVDVVKDADAYRRQLFENVGYMTNLGITQSPSPIQPIMLGCPTLSADAESTLIRDGLFVRAVHHPTVPKHESRLRVTLSAHHNASHIDTLVQSFNEWGANYNLKQAFQSVGIP